MRHMTVVCFVTRSLKIDKASVLRGNAHCDGTCVAPQVLKPELALKHVCVNDLCSAHKCSFRLSCRAGIGFFSLLLLSHIAPYSHDCGEAASRVRILYISCCIGRNLFAVEKHRVNPAPVLLACFSIGLSIVYTIVLLTMLHKEFQLQR